MRGRTFLALASLLFCLLIAAQPALAADKVLPQFAEGFDGQSIWQTQLFVDGRPIGANQTIIDIFNPQGQFLHRVGPGEFLFMNGFIARSQFPVLGPIPLFGFFSPRDLLFQPLQTGFLVIQSPFSVNVTEVIRRFNLSGSMITQLVISPFDPFRRATLVSDEIQARVLAFALANTDTLKRAVGVFDFFPFGSQTPLFSFPFEIAPRSQFGSFLFDMFPELASGTLRGSIRISSDIPVSLTAVSIDGNTMQQVPIQIEQ